MNKLKEYFQKILEIIDYLAHKWWGQLILMTLPVFIIWFSFLFGIKIIATLDFTDLCYPLFTFYKNALANQTGLLINPLILNGFPSYGATYLGFLSPVIYLVFKILPLTLAVQWLLFFYLVLGGFFVGRILKELGCSAWAGIIAGYAFILSSSYIELPITANNLWLPLIFWLILLIIKRNSWLITILGGILAGMGLLTVHSNWMIITTVGALIFAAYLIITTERQKMWNLLLKIFIFFIIFFLIGLIQIIPSIVHVLNSVRTAENGLFSDVSSNSSSIYFGNLVKLFLPLISKIPYLPWGELITYIGILPLIFAIYTFWLIKKNKKVIFWQIFTGLFILLAIPHSPLLRLINYIPILGNLRTPARWVIPSLFSLSILSGFGFDGWLIDNHEIYKKKIYKIFKWILLLILVAIISLNIIYLFFSNQVLDLAYRYFDTHLYSQTQQLPLEHYHQVIKERYLNAIGQFIYNNLQIIVQVLVFVFSLLILKYFWFKNKMKKHFSKIAAMTVFINLIIIYPFFYSQTTLPADYVNNYEPATAEYIKAHPGKVLPFLQGQSAYEKLNVPYRPDEINRFIFHAELLVPDINMLYNISSIDGHESMVSERYARLLNLLGTTRLQGTGFKSENLNDLANTEEKINTFYQRQNLLDLFGVNYVISVYDLIEDENFKKVYATTATDYNIPFYVYKNKNPLPFVLLAKKVIFLESENLIDNFNIIRDTSNDFHEQTFIECNSCLIKQSAFTKSKEQQIKIIKQTNTKIEIEYKGENDNWLIINQNNMPGWEAHVDNQETEIYFANFVHQAIQVPSGEHTIIIEYKYPIKYFWHKVLNF